MSCGLAHTSSQQLWPADLQPRADAPADLAAGWIEGADAHGRPFIERADAGPGWDEAIDPPPTCDKCGGIVRWIDASGGLHCPTCSPPRTANRLRRLAAEARALYPAVVDRSKHVQTLLGEIPSGTGGPRARLDILRANSQGYGSY